MPESLRWLILKNKIDEAEKQLYKMSTWNRKEFPQRTWQDIKLQLGTFVPNTKEFSCVDLLKTAGLRKRSLVLFYLW